MQEMFQKIIDSLRGAVPKILFAAFVLVVGFIVIKLLVKLLKKALGRFELDPSLIGFFVKATNIVLFVVLILCVLAILGVPTTGMIAAMSAAAVAVSLALKDSLSNIAQGILLLISHPFSTGDFVEVGGVSGSVMEVDMLQTTLRTADNRKVIIPNSQVATSEIINYSSETERRVEVVFPISYNDDVEKAKALIVKIAERHPLVDLEKAAPFARVSAYNDSSVSITCRVWCETENYWSVYYDILEQVREEFTAAGINIPYNQLDVHIVKDEK